MSFKVGDKIHIWFKGDAKRSGNIIRETPKRYLVEFWNGEGYPRKEWRNKDEVYDSLIGVNQPNAESPSNSGQEEGT